MWTCGLNTILSVMNDHLNEEMDYKGLIFHRSSYENHSGISEEFPRMHWISDNSRLAEMTHFSTLLMGGKRAVSLSIHPIEWDSATTRWDEISQQIAPSPPTFLLFFSFFFSARMCIKPCRTVDDDCWEPLFSFSYPILTISISLSILYLKCRKMCISHLIIWIVSIS